MGTCQNFEIVELRKVTIGHSRNVRFDIAFTVTIIIQAQKHVYITRNRMPDDQKNTETSSPSQGKPGDSKNTCASPEKSDKGAEPDSPVSTPTHTQDLDALIAPLNHKQLVDLRSRLDAKLPPPPAPPLEPPIQTKVLFVAFLASIVSVDPAAFLILASFGPLSLIFGTLVPAFAVFALAPAFLPLVLFVFCEPSRNAIGDAAHEFRNVLALCAVRTQISKSKKNN